MKNLYKNITFQLIKYLLRPICIIIGIICLIILHQYGIFAVKSGILFLFIPIGLFLCVLGNICTVACVKQVDLKSDRISIDYVNGFKTKNYSIKKSNISKILAVYKLKKYFFIEPLTNGHIYSDNPAGLYDLFITIVLNNGKQFVLKHNVEQLDILDIFEPLTKIVPNIQINMSANISKEIEQTNKLRSFTPQYNGTLWQFNNEQVNPVCKTYISGTNRQKSSYTLIKDCIREQNWALLSLWIVAIILIVSGCLFVIYASGSIKPYYH